MNCDCSVETWEAAPELFRSQEVTARKNHICCECHGEIKQGDKYELVNGLWDGEFSTFKTCIPCQSIREDYCSGGFYYGGLAEAIWECLGVKL